MMTNPSSNNATLTSSTTTFAWTTSTGVSQYAIWVGSTPETYDIYAKSEGLSGSDTLRLSGDGSPIYVRLWTLISGTWYIRDYSYQSWFNSTSTAPRRARMTSPTFASALTAKTTTFTWDAGNQVSQYAIWVGSKLGTYDLYAKSEGTAKSDTITLPTDGRALYVTLWSMIGGKWTSNTYIYAASQAPAPAPAQLITPSDGMVLSSDTVTFAWTAGVGVDQYALWVGSAPNSYDWYAKSEGKNLHDTVSNLPTDGTPIYVTLWSHINGNWETTSYTYISGTLNSAKLKMVSPAPGSTLASDSVTFTWNNNSSYAIWVGTQAQTYGLPTAYNLLAQTGSGQSVTVKLPTDGQKLYVTLWTPISGQWVPNCYVYTEAMPNHSQITSLVDNSTLTSDSVSLAWGEVANATDYSLFIGTTKWSQNLLAWDELTYLSDTISYLPSDGSPIYITTRAQSNGTYYWRSHQYLTYTNPTYTGPRKARMISPTFGSTLTAGSVTFSWDTGNNVEQYAIWVGNRPLTYDLYAKSEGRAQSDTVTLPTDGRELYVTLWSMIDGQWQVNNYVYEAWTATGIGTQKAQMSSPAIGTTLPSGQTTFKWSAGIGADQYAIWVGSQPDTYDLYAKSEGTAQTDTVSLPTNGKKLYVKLWSHINGNWESNSYVYTAYQYQSSSLGGFIMLTGTTWANSCSYTTVTGTTWAN